MCGIIGFSGKEQAVDILLSGLERLEYRGYDSAGVAIYENGNINITKAKGRLSNLRERVKENVPVGNTGIGHTRWATHGEPSDQNAHPHFNMAGNIALVHNGIIENYQTLKSQLLKKGIKFVSETDTEVVVHLLSENYNGNMPEAIRKTLSLLKGSFALGIICTDYPDTIFCTRKDSPLIVGKGAEESYIASDIPAILEYTRNIFLLNDFEIAVL